MEGLTRLAAESLARHGFDRPLDYRRLHWSRWFRCESHHSLLSVPSKPGVFALAEEVMELTSSTSHVGADALVRPERSECIQPHAADPRRMLAVSQFYEADDMAFMLDRMLSYQNPMRARLASGRYFFRFVVIEEAAQRRSISSALNAWMTSAAEKANGIGSHFASSLDLTPEQHESGVPHACPEPSRRVSPPLRDLGTTPFESARSTGPVNVAPSQSSPVAPHLDSGAAANIHCPPFPSGF